MKSMPRVTPVVPDEGILICEGCGYILTGLPGDSRCPECGKPICESSPQLRALPEWERTDSGRSSFGRFWGTTVAVILRPGEFYRTLATRVDTRQSNRFALIHLVLVSLMLGVTGALQYVWLKDVQNNPAAYAFAFGVMTLVWSVTAYAGLEGLTHCAAHLTAWEASYRGLRLPFNVVLRGLRYHTPHYLPVAVVAFLTVAGYQVLVAVGVLTELAAPGYLYVLCGEVVVAAAYLFNTYWRVMRNMMFANG